MKAAKDWRTGRVDDTPKPSICSASSRGNSPVPEESAGWDAFEAAVRTVRDVFFPDRTDLDHWTYRRFEGMYGAAAS